MNQTAQLRTDQGMEKAEGGGGRKSWEEKTLGILPTIALNILFWHGNDKRQGLSGYSYD